MNIRLHAAWARLAASPLLMGPDTYSMGIVTLHPGQTSRCLDGAIKALPGKLYCGGDTGAERRFVLNKPRRLLEPRRWPNTIILRDLDGGHVDVRIANLRGDWLAGNVVTLLVCFLGVICYPMLRHAGGSEFHRLVGVVSLLLVAGLSVYWIDRHFLRPSGDDCFALTRLLAVLPPDSVVFFAPNSKRAAHHDARDVIAMLGVVPCFAPSVGFPLFVWCLEAAGAVWAAGLVWLYWRLSRRSGDMSRHGFKIEIVAQQCHLLAWALPFFLVAVAPFQSGNERHPAFAPLTIVILAIGWIPVVLAESAWALNYRRFEKARRSFSVIAGTPAAVACSRGDRLPLARGVMLALALVAGLATWGVAGTFVAYLFRGCPVAPGGVPDQYVWLLWKLTGISSAFWVCIVIVHALAWLGVAICRVVPPRSTLSLGPVTAALAREVDTVNHLMHPPVEFVLGTGVGGSAVSWVGGRSVLHIDPDEIGTADASLRTFIIAHELAHIRNRDHVGRRRRRLLSGLVFVHPGALESWERTFQEELDADRVAAAVVKARHQDLNAVLEWLGVDDRDRGTTSPTSARLKALRGESAFSEIRPQGEARAYYLKLLAAG